jgi:MFS family permease
MAARAVASYRRHLRALSRNAWLYLISNAIQAISAGALAVLYTLYLTALGYDTSFIGLVLVIGSIGGGLGIIPAGWVVRRAGWRATLLASDVIGGIALLAQFLWPTTPVILVTSLGAGASVALLLVVNTPFLAAHSGEAERTAIFGLNNALAFLGAVVGALLGGLLPVWLARPAAHASGVLAALSPLLAGNPTARGYQLALLVTGALAVPSIIPVFLLREEPRLAIAAAPRAPGGMRRAMRSAMLALRAWLAAPNRRQAWETARGPIGRFALTQSLIGFGAGLYGPYLNIYFVNDLHASTPLFGALSSALTVLLALASLLIVPVAERLGGIRSAVISQFASLPFLLLIGFAPTLAIAAVAYLIRGPLMNAANPPLQAFLMASVTSERRVFASGVYNVSWQLAGAIGAGAGGVLVHAVGYPSTIAATTALYAAGIALVAVWFGRSAVARKA